MWSGADRSGLDWRAGIDGVGSRLPVDGTRCPGGVGNVEVTTNEAASFAVGVAPPIDY